MSFIFTNDWDPSQNAVRGPRRSWSGTLITSGIALLIGVPVAIATALYVTELAPARVRQPLTILVELLAAVPSVVYGLWGDLLPAPEAPAGRAVVRRHVLLPAVRGRARSPVPNYFIAGLILAIMILPIVSAISREVMATVPIETKEAALALGATRWEMIRMAVLPYSRRGHRRRRRCSAWAARSARRSP